MEPRALRCLPRPRCMAARDDASRVRRARALLPAGRAAARAAAVARQRVAHMNPYYAVAFLSALFFWVWPGLIYKTLDANGTVVVAVAAAIFIIGGRGAPPVQIRVIAPPKELPRKKKLLAASSITSHLSAPVSR